VVTWSGLGGLRGSALPGTCLGGAEVVRRMAPHKLRGPHDQAHIQAKGCNPIDSSQGRQARLLQTIDARTVQIRDRIRYQARPYHCNAANIGWRDDCVSRHRDRVAAAFRAWLSCWCSSQKARSQPYLGEIEQGTSLSSQGGQGCACRCRPSQTGGLMRCRRKAAMVVLRPRRLLRTRSASARPRSQRTSCTLAERISKSRPCSSDAAPAVFGSRLSAPG
jgi:hypothetical protein